MGVSEEISSRSLDVLKLMSALPLITVAREYCWGLLIKGKKTRHVVLGKSINLVTLAVSVVALTLIHPANAAVIGAVSMLVSQAAELVYLWGIMKTRSKIFDIID